MDMAFEKPDGSPATNNLENITLITNYFQNVFNNNNNTVDIPDVINDLGTTKPIIHETVLPPSTDEIISALKE